jgi:DNA mismatch endonuclease (patch repair protein)
VVGAEEAAGSNVHQGQGPEAFPTRPPRETEDIPTQLRVRELAHALGYRFRLRRADLPGVPDLAFPRLRRAVLVRGCPFPGHPRCTRVCVPVPVAGRWHVAQEQSAAHDHDYSHDQEALAALAATGWVGLVVWACELGDEAAVRARLATFLGRG